MPQAENIFQVARDRGWDWRDILDLTGGVNPLGPAPGVLDAVREAAGRIAHYPERTPALLVEKLARRWQVGADQILLGNGASELIHFTARMWRKETATIAVPAPGEFRRAHPLARDVAWNEPHLWPEQGIMLFSQPNIPIGQTLAMERLEQYLLATTNPVIVDESFIEFTGSPSLLRMIGRRPNLFVLRSLSRFYALPGLRIGALVGDAGNLASLREKREPWQVNALAEVAALKSLEDIDYAARTRELVGAEREWMWQELRKIPTLTPVQSEASFILIYLASGAADIRRWFENRKILVWNCTGSPGLEGEAICVGVSAREVNERVVSMFRQYITGSA